MSWEVGSLLIVCFLLALGFRWYEKTRPSARMVALVATLAALAAVGRLAFAVLPNVKPTSDIVFCAGFALGGVPGFIVGALAAFVSNMVFGHGWWTPWQMLAWGVVGVYGALVGTIYRKRWEQLQDSRILRVSLALCCGVAGLIYGLIVDTGQWFAFSGDQRSSTLIATYIASLPWNLVHALANVSFFLIFGPVLLRSLLRARDRLTVHWQSRPESNSQFVSAKQLLCVLVSGSALISLCQPMTAQADGRVEAVQYLQRAQNSDGGFGAAAKQSSTQMHTAWVILGLAAVGENPSTLRKDGKSPVDFLVKTVHSVNDLGGYERTVMALAAVGRSVRNVSGLDLVAEITRAQGADGSFASQTNLTAFAILSLRAAGFSPSRKAIRSAVRWLSAQQNTDGGFNFAMRGGASGVDDTAAALQALVAGKGSRRRVKRAQQFLRSQQNLDGGFPLTQGAQSNAQSAAWAAQAFAAAGVNASSVRRQGSRSAPGYLLSLQASDGSIRYSRSSSQTPVWVTAQALTALAGRPFPFRAQIGSRRKANGGSRWHGVRQVVSKGVNSLKVHHVRSKSRRAKRYKGRKGRVGLGIQAGQQEQLTVEHLLYPQIIRVGKFIALLL